MSSSTTIPAIRGTVIVNAPPERAFEVFTKSFGSWWPADYHIGQVDMADGVIEPREGGRWYEKGADGSECDWGRVLVWEPPNRLVISWQINGMWQFDDDPAHASEIEVRFSPEGEEQTTVELEHRHLVAGTRSCNPTLQPLRPTRSRPAASRRCQPQMCDRASHD
jgi:uncharacterized protein YndB with AHSA1/START domain